MNFFRMVVLSLVTLGLISCQHSDSGPATGPVNKEQLKGSWQLVAVQDASGNTVPATNMVGSGTKLQLQINDDDFNIIFADDRGANTVLNYKYSIKGRIFAVDKSSGFPDIEIVSVLPNRIVAKFMTNEKGQPSMAVLETFDRILDSQLATKNKVHIPQTMAVDYTFTGADKKKRDGSFYEEAEFRGSDKNKMITCYFLGSGADRYLNVQYYEFTSDGSSVHTDSSKDSLVQFRVPVIGFDNLKDSEEIDVKGTPTTNTYLFLINDIPNQAMISGSDGATCNYHVSRIKNSLQITGDCSGSPSYMYKDAVISLKASCEMESY